MVMIAKKFRIYVSLGNLSLFSRKNHVLDDEKLKLPSGAT
jgi:hypothetical protein